MVKETVLGGIIEFFQDIGVYDVILPFILVFTIVFAVLEKTAVLGYQIDPDNKERKFTRKNLNSMLAFCIAFFVVASSKLVSIINEAMGNIVLLVLVSVSFLMLLGSFLATGEVALDKEKDKILYGIMAAIMFIGVLMIFLHAIPTDDGEPWLEWFWEYLVDNWDTNWVGALILILLIVVFMVWITKAPTEIPDKKVKTIEEKE